MELYIHIPFCKSKCCYCDFASWADQEQRIPAYVDAVLAEAAMRPCDEEVDTVFLGGGTPSILPAEQLERLLTGIRSRYQVRADAEFTSEANPGTLTEAWLDAASAGGVNRISLGMQAAQPELLRKLGRIHTFAQVESSVEMCRRRGITNLNLDLMFGLPGQTEAEWLETLQAALALHPTHLSCYGLIPEEGTFLWEKLNSGAWHLPDEDEERAMYDQAIRRLGEHGFAQYEISNFALPGYECRHNIGYWRQEPYIGLGASAASMRVTGRHPFACERTTNPRGIPAYLNMISSGTITPAEREAVAGVDARFETIMLGLRMTEGVPERLFQQLHGAAIGEIYGNLPDRLQARGLLEHRDGYWRLTRRGMDIQNSILVEFL